MSKKILFHSNHSRAFTGFGKNLKNLLLYFYRNTDYEIVELAAGLVKNHPELQKQPWKAYGTLPEDPNTINQLNKDPASARAASYGSMMIDEIIKEERPDVYITIEDFWAFTACGLFDKPWWNKVNCICWTTLDSLPLLPDSIKHAPNIKNYYTWSPFATEALHKEGFEQAETLHGSLDTKNFFKLMPFERVNLRKENNISDQAFIVGFVFRNQLRKSVPNLLLGFQQFKKENPLVDAYLFLHTNWTEGWDIPRLIKEHDIPNEKIITTYICRECHRYEIKPFTGHDLACPHCKAEKGQITTNVNIGVNEVQLNEVYNLMNVYCHPFTSGGQEIPVQEAKLTELITLVTDYSCGQEYAMADSGGIALEWSEYREPGTQFIKASTYPSSIAKQLKKVYNMTQSKRDEWGKRARQYVVDSCAVEVVAKQLMEKIESMPPADYSFDWNVKLKNPDAIISDNPDDKEWVLELYTKILYMEDPKEGLGHWLARLKEGASRGDIHNYFKQIAQQENQKLQATNEKTPAEDIFSSDKERKLALVIPESLGDVFVTTSLLKSARETYPEYAVFFICDPKYFEILLPLVPEYIDKLIPYQQEFESQLWMEGHGPHKGYVDIVKYLHFPTQRQLNYLNNGLDKIAFDTQFKEESSSN